MSLGSRVVVQESVDVRPFVNGQMVTSSTVIISIVERIGAFKYKFDPFPDGFATFPQYMTEHSSAHTTLLALMYAI